MCLISWMWQQFAGARTAATAGCLLSSVLNSTPIWGQIIKRAMKKGPCCFKRVVFDGSDGWWVVGGFVRSWQLGGCLALLRFCCQGMAPIRSNLAHTRHSFQMPNYAQFFCPPIILYFYHQYFFVFFLIETFYILIAFFCKKKNRKIYLIHSPKNLLNHEL